MGSLAGALPFPAVEPGRASHCIALENSSDPDGLDTTANGG